MKALSGSTRGFTTETLVATYKAIVRPILNYAASIWFTQVSSSHLGKLEVIQNKALRIATGFHQKPEVSHLRAETGVLHLRVHLELCSQQFYASALQPLAAQSSNRHLPSRPQPLQGYPPEASYHRILRCLRVRNDVLNSPSLIFGGVLEEGAYPLSQTPPTSLNDRGDRPVSGTQQSAHGHSPSN